MRRVEGNSTVAEAEADNATHSAEHHETRSLASWVCIKKVGDTGGISSDEREVDYKSAISKKVLEEGCDIYLHPFWLKMIAIQWKRSGWAAAWP